MTCARCASTFARYTWPMTATLAAGDDSITVPAGQPRTACPECGEPIAGDVDLHLD